MADAITIKALQDASLDAKSLEEVVNGNETKQVTTRLGESYPSVKKAIKTLFENGGLPATPFATKALMTASALVDGKYAQVTDDTVNNGLYVKKAGAWVKSAYDPTALAKAYIDNQSYGQKSIQLVAGNIDSAGNVLVSGQYAISYKFLKTTANDKLVIQGYGVGAPTGYGYYISSYDSNKQFISRSPAYSQNSQDRIMDLPEGYVKIGVTSNDQATRESLLKRQGSFYIRYNKLQDNYVRVEDKNHTVTSKIDLEVGYLEKTKKSVYTDIGRINNSSNVTAAFNFLGEMRSRKFLQVIGNSDIAVTFDDGVCNVFEYNENYDCTGFFTVINAGKYTLSADTKYIKVSVDNVVKFEPTVFITFESASSAPKFIYNANKNNIGANISFIYEAYPNQGMQVFDSPNVEQYSTTRYFNTGLLKLPPNYDPLGEPVRLIIFVQGSAGYLSINNGTMGTSYESYTELDKGVFNYWLNEGYAVLGVYPWTSKYDIPIATNSGTPTGMAAYKQGYQWVIDNYNVRQDGVFVSGKSSGGYCGAMLAFNMGIPVLAVGLLAPVISPVFAQLAPNIENRKAAADDFGFVGDHTILDLVGTFPSTAWRPAFNEYMRQNGEKMIGYNPWWSGVINEDITALIEGGLDGSDGVYELMKHRKRVCSVPFKIWCAVDDDVTTYQPSRAFIQSIRNTNGTAELRTMPNGTGGHASVDTSSVALRVPTITTKLGIVHKDIALAIVELVQYFRRFG